MSETSKRTPGIWTASCDREDIDEANVILAGDTVIAYVFESPELRERHRQGKIEGPGSTAGPDTLDEVDANARAMAAAKELLAELKHAEFRCIGDTCPRCGYDDIAGHKDGCSLAAAIAKAEAP